MEKQILNDNQSWEPAAKLGGKYDVVSELIMSAFLGYTILTSLLLWPI